MNSFSAIAKAIDHEIERQEALMRAGKYSEVVQETRLWDEGSQKTVSMRKKEGAADYRFFPEPDLPALEITDALLAEVRAAMPETPEQARERVKGMGLSKQDTLLLTEDAETLAFFDAVVAAGAEAKASANWLMGDVTALLKEQKQALAQQKLTPQGLAEFISLIADGTISGKARRRSKPCCPFQPLTRSYRPPLLSADDSPRTPLSLTCADWQGDPPGAPGGGRLGQGARGEEGPPADLGHGRAREDHRRRARRERQAGARVPQREGEGQGLLRGADHEAERREGQPGAR